MLKQQLVIKLAFSLNLLQRIKSKTKNCTQACMHHGGWNHRPMEEAA